VCGGGGVCVCVVLCGWVGGEGWEKCLVGWVNKCVSVCVGRG